MNIILCRHGQTDWSKISKLQGRTDTLLTNNGISQAADISNLILENNFVNINTIYTSNLSRCYDTACIISNNINVKNIVTDDRLIEKAFGDLTGLFYKDVKEEVHLESAIGLEKTSNVNKRVQDFLKYLENKNYNQVVVVTHSYVLKAIYEYYNREYTFDESHSKITTYDTVKKQWSDYNK